MGKIYKNGIEYGGGGGGSAGHIILDDDGTAMAEEPNLQFKGLNVTDNSTDEITEVESAGLNQDSMDDVLNASIPGNQVASNGMSYSTEEQVVGKWIDGRPLYQKTWTGTVSFNSGSQCDLITSLPANIDENYSWVDDSASFFCHYPGLPTNSGTRQSGFTYGNSYMQMWLANPTLIRLRCDNMGDGTNIPYVCTLKYTKTTD